MTPERALLLAEAYVRMKRGARALEVLKDADPENALSWLWRANALHSLGRYAEAAANAEQGLALDGESPYLYDALARARLRLEQPEEAEEAIRESLRLHPHYAQGHSILAVILTSTNRRAEAAEASERAIALGPERPDVRSLDVFVKVMTGSRETADELSRQLLADAPDDPAAHYLRAMALGMRGDARAATRHYREAARLEPDNAIYVKAARVSGHWAFWPLRLIGPRAWIAGCVAFWFLLMEGLFFHPGRWTYAPHVAGYLAYVFISTVAFITLPLRK